MRLLFDHITQNITSDQVLTDYQLLALCGISEKSTLDIQEENLFDLNDEDFELKSKVKESTIKELKNFTKEDAIKLEAELEEFDLGWIEQI